MNYKPPKQRHKSIHDLLLADCKGFGHFTSTTYQGLIASIQKQVSLRPDHHDAEYARQVIEHLTREAKK